MYSIATLASKVLPESNVKDILRHLYYNTIWFNRNLKKISNYLSLLETYSIAFEVDLKDFGIKTKIGPNNARHVFYVDSNVHKEVLENIWYYFVLRYLSLEKREKLLPLIYASAHHYFVGINEIFKSNVYERHYTLKHGDIVLDIGANYGVFTIKAAREVGEEGLVVAIEPDPDHVKYLERNIELNGLNNIIVVRKAAWSSREKLKFKRFVFGRANSVANLHPDNVSEFDDMLICVGEVAVDADTIDNIVEELGLSRVDFIKMDIERSEVEAIKGAWNTLQRFSPKLSVAAYHRIPPTYERSYKILEPMLKGIGYKTIAERPLKENPEEVILYAWK